MGVSVGFPVEYRSICELKTKIGEGSGWQIKSEEKGTRTIQYPVT